MLIGSTTTDLLIPQNVLQPGQTYKFKLTASIAGSPDENTQITVDVVARLSRRYQLQVTGDGTQYNNEPISLQIKVIDPMTPSVNIPAIYYWTLEKCPGELQVTDTVSGDKASALGGSVVLVS